ncbi:hypothetical protein ACHAXA_005567 [Cyclostephanos tholiformis]|uniref:AIG1-type G domain-containing protein n=1 Tax=Cyclostephanos tholiformis TaxID=382380 RepID=A0ABD3SGQ6_9STRA
MERFLNAPLNIVQEGTGTRCSLDTTCIYDSSLTEPKCELSGKELEPSLSGTNLTNEEVFAAITRHNKELRNQDKFSTKPLKLVYHASNVQNMKFVDTPGIIANQVSVNAAGGTSSSNTRSNILASIFMLNISAAAHSFNSMKSTGKDNREDIKSILRDTMKKPNSKLYVLVEPKEFSTNTIINFCDETFGGKGKWVNNAIVLMTKFDKQLEDSRSGSKCNKFFSEYFENNLFPYLTITEEAIKIFCHRFQDESSNVDRYRDSSPRSIGLSP